MTSNKKYNVFMCQIFYQYAHSEDILFHHDSILGNWLKEICY